ncbi:TatD family hydrolase [Elizabethkingia anophelis]|uniref:TatD family hydrolase n=1 Tax=Elizabethkingia anophelis TaxID=1117645 RepID=UPI0034627AEC|nr:TatD family hydrolase [Elizabethkingia anophelis]
MLFDFHHHHKNPDYKGVYNKSIYEEFSPEFYSIGLHPQDISDNWESEIEKIHTTAKASNCLSIGECGLDAFVNASIEVQIEVFKSQILIAEELQKPLTIHCVRRYNEVINTCKGISIPKIIHGFNKKETIATQLLQNGFYLSFGASLLNNLSLQKIFRRIPKETFVLETDTAEINIEKLYEKAAIIRGISMTELENIVDYNLKTIFRW